MFTVVAQAVTNIIESKKRTNPCPGALFFSQVDGKMSSEEKKNISEFSSQQLAANIQFNLISASFHSLMIGC